MASEGRRRSRPAELSAVATASDLFGGLSGACVLFSLLAIHLQGVVNQLIDLVVLEKKIAVFGINFEFFGIKFGVFGIKSLTGVLSANLFV